MMTELNKTIVILTKRVAYTFNSNAKLLEKSNNPIPINPDDNNKINSQNKSYNRKRPESIHDSQRGKQQ